MIDEAMTERVMELVTTGRRFLVACHRRPDADAVGSALGFAAVLEAVGKDVVVYVPDELPLNLRFLACTKIERSVTGADFDAVFVMDTAANALLPDGLPDVRPLVIVDHHAAHDDVGDLVVRDVDACATAEVVMDLAERLGVRPVPPEAATPLYAAIVADTGGFRYPSTRARVLRMGAELIDGGAEPWAVAYELFEGWEPARMKLLGAVLDTLEMHADGRVAMLRVSRAMLDDCEAKDEMVEGLVNYARMLRGVEAAGLVWEFAGTRGLETKVSLRSRGELDVSRVAADLGGGGHRTAAGATLGDTLDETAAKVIAGLVALVDGPAEAGVGGARL